MRIAAIRALQLGDLLCAVPALRALDAEYPAARITLVGLPWARQFAERFRRYIDDFVEFPGNPGMPERDCNAAAALPQFFDAMKARRLDLTLQLHGSGDYMNPLAQMMGARRTAGFHPPGRPSPDAQRFLEWRDGEHEVLRWLRLIAHLGIQPRGSELEFPLTPQDWEAWRELRLRNYACVHPGSQLPSQRWPAERFAEVADALAGAGLKVVLTGTASEAHLTRRVAAAMRSPAVDLAGRTSLGVLGAIVARARLLVSNDTGISHIAAALRTPSVIVACGTDPQRWPLDRERHRVLSHEVDCRPSVLGISPREVLRHTGSLLACAA